MEAIRGGEHRRATLATTVSWAHRLLFGGRLLFLREQRMLLTLLADVWPARSLLIVVRCYPQHWLLPTLGSQLQRT